MKIIKFRECNVTFAEDQPEYLPLPALKMPDGQVISCWNLTIIERLKVLLTGKIWLSVLTFNKPLQPLLMATDKPFKIEKGGAKKCF
ncbi:MAG: hypothetical protein KKF27_20835 [Gammaproteobacteria bacterium]|nr:hypothetical protein [Gammaproteobacteria bacterium]